MGKSQATFSKKEKEKKRKEKQKIKEQRREERKANAKDGSSLEDMMAYVDENGNISSTPPDPTKKMSIKEEDIVLGSRNIGGTASPTLQKGRVISFNTAKGFGFIKDGSSGRNIFFHNSSVLTPITENDKVAFETQMGPKGLAAVNVRKV